jgi:hypothetical protein
MVIVKKYWKEKRTEREEEGGSVDQETGMVGEEKQASLEINLAFHLQQEFMLPKPKMAQLALGAERAVFEKPETLGQHMKPLYIRGHLGGVPMNQILVDGSMCQHNVVVSV